MGQCLSSAGSARAASEEPAAQTGVYDRLIHPPVHPPVPAAHGSQAVVSQAKVSADGSPAVPLLVRATPHHVFVALFEGLGEDRRSVAAFCRARVWETYQEAAAAHPGSPLEALKDTLARLDAAVLASDRLKPAAKARSGASAVLLLLDLGSRRCYCANVGAAACLLSRISGSFQAKTPEGFFLTREHTTRNREEVVRLQKRAPGEATPPPSARSVSTMAGEAAEATRALGFAEAKRAAGGSGALVCEAAATDHTLSPTDQHLVIGTAAFWQLVGPADAALRAHFHEKFAKREMDRAAAEAAALAATAGVQEAPSPSLLQAANTAEHLVWWALEKATRRLVRLQGGRSMQGRRGKLPPSAADLLALPLVRPPPAEEAGEGADGSPVRGTPARQQEAQQAQQLIRGDVLAGDLGVVVITLRQAQSADGGMRQFMLAARARADAAAAAAAAAAAKQKQGQAGGGKAAAGAGPGGNDYVERLARRRWDQVRMLVDFHKAHRRVVLKQWADASDAVFRRGRSTGASRIDLGKSPSRLQALAAASAARALSARKAGGGAEDRPATANAVVSLAAEAAAAKGSPSRVPKPSPTVSVGAAGAGGKSGLPSPRLGGSSSGKKSAGGGKRSGSRIGAGAQQIKAVRQR
ncbi:phosphatase 2C 3 [Chlorella sorokiniana]|uniref:Phosphatase 2C 3 n=1 Tax=Chlorella sorokiniana TaxID=3076 RepID=A0A2P6TYX0_CHLSO|nr:phosphatase 2C 3 [Chlorella sorokiniana]|eukprot:PRW59267.1 phosphatase 2C 3 [Chlorella sorokiniana]